jgi:hypothetical protein
MRPEGIKTKRENAEIDFKIRAAKVDVALQEFADSLCAGRFQEARNWMELARKILRDHNGYGDFVSDSVEDPVRYLLSRERTPIRERDIARPNGLVVLDRVLQVQLKSVVSDSKWEVPVCA